MVAFTNPDTIHRASTGAVAPAAWGDTVNDDLNALYGDTAWTAVTYSNSWVDYGTGHNATGFRKVGTRVVLRGAMKSGTINAAAFTLPAGYRPTATVEMAVYSNNGTGSTEAIVTITSAGVLTPTIGSNTFFSLEGVNFDTI